MLLLKYLFLSATLLSNVALGSLTIFPRPPPILSNPPVRSADCSVKTIEPEQIILALNHAAYWVQLKIRRGKSQPQT